MDYQHIKAFVEAVQADRDAAAVRRRLSAEAAELERIVIRAAARDDDAWSSLIQRFAPGIRATARAHRLGTHDAEDVVQSAWLELLTHIRRVCEPAKVGGWLHTTARRQSVRAAIAARPRAAAR